MVILDEENLERSNEALDRGLNKEIDIEEAVAAALAIEPRNVAAVLVLAGSRITTNVPGAQECFWQAIRLTPTRAVAYLSLAATHQTDDPALARALTGLGLAAASALQAVPDAVHDLIPIVYPERDTSALDLSDPAVIAMLADEVKAQAARHWEPAHVAEQLRPYRWLMTLCSDHSDDVDPAALVAEGRQHAQEYEALLHAALSETFTYELGIHSAAACRLTALLGEIGGPDSLADLDELAGVDDLNVAMHAQWSIWRIGQRFPQQTAAAIPGGDALLDWRWADTADQLYLLPAGTDITPAVALFAEQIRANPKTSEAEYVLAVLRRALLRHGASDEWKQRLAALAHRLSNKQRPFYEETLQADPFVPQLVDEGMRPAEIFEVLTGDLFDEDLNFDDGLFDDEDDEDFEDLEEDAEEDEDEPYVDTLAVPAPPAPKLGRNDSCWCGSGKKYKKCHLAEDEEKQRQGFVTSSTAKPAAPAPPHFRLRDRMVEEIMQRAGKATMLAALGRYSGGSSIDEMDDTDHACFIDWLLFDFRLPNGKTPCEDYRDRHRAQLTTKELAQFDAWIRARYGMWEVQRVDAGVGMLLKNLATDEELFVHDVASTTQLVRWDVMLQRVEQADGRNMFVGHGYTVPRNLLPAMWGWIDETCGRTGQDRAAAIISSSHELHRALKELHKASLRNLRIENFDGDKLELGEAAYQVSAPDEVKALLRAQKDVWEADENGQPIFRHTLPNKKDGDDTTVATIVFKSDQLLLRCNSRRRLRAQRKWLEELAGPLVEHVGDKFQSVDEAQQQAIENMAFQEKPDPPSEEERDMLQRYQDEHYAKWLDIELPALQGKTPRQAARSKAGRAALEQLLRTMENAEARRRRETGVGFDFSTIRKQLKLDE